MDKNAISQLEYLLKEETVFFKDKETQFVNFCNVRITIIGGARDTNFLMGLLYELYSGELFGDQCLVRVYLLDVQENLEKVEMVYGSLWTSGLPLFNGLKLTSKLERALRKASYVIINPDIRWSDNREAIVGDNIEFLNKIGFAIKKYCQEVDVLLIGTVCTSVFRLILSICLNGTQNRIHVVTRGFERAAASLIGNKMKCDPYMIQGIAVFGEDIIETANSWSSWTADCKNDQLDKNSLKLADPFTACQLQQYEDLKKNKMRLPIGSYLAPYIPNFNEDLDLPEIVRLSKEEQEQIKTKDAEDKNKWDKMMGKIYKYMLNSMDDLFDNEINTRKLKKKKEKYLKRPKKGWNHWMRQRFPKQIQDTEEEDEFNNWDQFFNENTIADAIIASVPENWRSTVHNEPMVFPEDNEDKIDVEQKKAVRYVANHIKDQVFLKELITMRCRKEMRGFGFAKAVINYMKKAFFSNDVIITNMMVCSPGIYGIPPGIFSSFPVRLEPGGKVAIVRGFQLSHFTADRIKKFVEDAKRDYEQVFGMVCHELVNELETESEFREEVEQNVNEEIIDDTRFEGQEEEEERREGLREESPDDT